MAGLAARPAAVHGRGAVADRFHDPRILARRGQELPVLFKSVQELIFRTDPHGKARFVNARWHAITHQPIESARGKHLRDTVHPEYRDSVDALFAPIPPSRVRMAQPQLTGPDGGPRALDISAVPLRNPTGQLRGFAGSVELPADTCPDGGQMRFHVTDTGPGIPASLHGVIFEKLSQGHARISDQHGGAVLGLSLSRALAELLGGTLTVGSAVGEGSTFTLSLPLRPPSQAAALPAQT